MNTEKTMQINYLNLEDKKEVSIYADWISDFLEMDIELLNKFSKELWGKLRLDYTKWDILALIHHISSEGDRNNFNYIQRLFLIADLFHGSLESPEKETYLWNKAAMRDYSCMVLSKMGTEEGCVNSWVRKNLESKYQNSKLVKVYAIERKRPDFLISINNIIYPVECKLTFGTAALKQLQNYMSLWEVDKGIAVARKLTIELPSNIDFHLVQY